MKRGSQTRLLAITLAVLTLAVLGLAVANFIQQGQYVAPTDGIRWTEAAGGLQAYVVPADAPGARAGVKRGDVLTAINGVSTPQVAAADFQLVHVGVWKPAMYSLLRHVAGSNQSIALDIPVILEPADHADLQLRIIALVYLCIGIYVLFRRWTAPKSTHFYVFCLVSFILYAFKYTERLDALDQVILWANFAAYALQPALFLHFAATFRDFTERRRTARALTVALYAPGAALLLLRYLSLYRWVPTARLQHRLDQTDYIYLAAYYVVAAAVFWVRYRREQQPLQRQQLKWLSRGTILTVAPFTILYVVPFLLDVNVPVALANVAVLFLILLPLTFSWAIVRYRLMDVDLIFKRGVTYTLATAALVGAYFGFIALAAEIVHSRVQSERLREWGLASAVIVTGLVFEPLKRLIQARVDSIFDQKRLDYRETLVEFGRELNAQTDLDALLHSIVERLPQTLLLTRVAVFLAEPRHGSSRTQFRLSASHGVSFTGQDTAGNLDLGFLDFDSRDSQSHVFFENPQTMLRLPEEQRRTAAALDLHYYVPCRAAEPGGYGLSTIAVLGLGRTGEGDFLSSEDVELLESLAGYIGIAIQNAQLYHSLERKMAEFERLRDFNENIVESINIGVFAVDLDDRIESWNAQMEVMYATPRAEALRKPLAKVFSADFLQEFDRLRAEQGVYTLYKFRLPTPTGEARTANITIAPLLNKDFNAVGRIVIVDDITDRINMETQLTQAEKLSSIGLLAAGVAHEVNTPLAVISSYAQMLGKQLRGDEATQARLQPVLDKITQQTFRASEIVNGLLNFSRMGSVDFVPVDVNAMVRDTRVLLEAPLRSSRVLLETDLSPDVPRLYGNVGKLQQVIVNLVLNAKDALQDRGSGRVRIMTRAIASGVQISVEDDGIGMPPDVMRKIYDPFFTTKGNPKEGQRKGTGLGLSVTYGIVQEHAGTIEVDSTVGEGTAFRLFFPSAEAGEVRGKRPKAPDHEQGKALHV